MNQRILGGLVLSFLALSGLTSCNLYGGIDSPSGDPQLISAARAAFDQGDYASAMKYYQQLSTSSRDIQLSEEAYVTFNQAGGTIANFAAAFGNGKNVNVGSAMSIFAVSLKPFAGSANRLAVFNAFKNYQTIKTDNTQLAALVQFLGAITMAGLVLAEDVPASHAQYLKSDVCPPTGVPGPTCPGAGILAAGAALTAGAGASMTQDIANPGDFSATPANFEMFNAAMIDVSNAITVLGSAGSFGSNFTSLTTTLTAAPPATIPGGVAAYRAAMVTAGIGQ